MKDELIKFLLFTLMFVVILWMVLCLEFTLGCKLELYADYRCSWFFLSEGTT
jgi:hypothetical protein